MDCLLADACIQDTYGNIRRITLAVNYVTDTSNAGRVTSGSAARGRKPRRIASSAIRPRVRSGRAMCIGK